LIRIETRRGFSRYSLPNCRAFQNRGPSPSYPKVCGGGVSQPSIEISYTNGKQVSINFESVGIKKLIKKINVDLEAKSKSLEIEFEDFTSKKLRREISKNPHRHSR
jgi:hypothetical protein